MKNMSTKPFTYEYDSAQDALYIFFEPVDSATFYEDVTDLPHVMLRYSLADERLVGVTMHHVAEQLKTDPPTDPALRQLAQDLIRKLQAIIV